MNIAPVHSRQIYFYETLVLSRACRAGQSERMRGLWLVGLASRVTMNLGGAQSERRKPKTQSHLQGMYLCSLDICGHTRDRHLVPENACFWRVSTIPKRKVYNARTYAKKVYNATRVPLCQFLVRIFSARNIAGRSNVGRWELKSSRQLTGRRISL